MGHNSHDGALLTMMESLTMMAWSLAHGCHGGALAYGAYALGDLLLSI